MSKEKYVEPKMDIVVFEAADIITTSTGAFDGEWVPIRPTDNEENNDFFIQ